MRMSAEETSEHAAWLPAWRIGTYAWRPAEDRLAWSTELVRLYGLERAPTAEKGFTALVHPADRVRVEGETSTYLGSSATRYSHSFRIVRPDGEVRVILDRGAIERDAAGQVVVIHGMNIDVTEDAAPEFRPAPDETVADAPGDTAPAPDGPIDPATILDSFLENARIGLGVWDRDFRFLRIGRELAAINGAPADEHIGRRPDEILPDFEAGEEIYRMWRQVLETGEPFRGVEISGETLAKTGRRVWEADYFPVHVDGRPVAIAATVQETTRRKIAEVGLRASETRYRALFDALDEGFCVAEVRQTDDDAGRIDYRIIEANAAFYQLTGFPPAILGRWLREAAPDLEEHWFETYGRVARTGEPARFEQRSEMLGRWFDVYAFRVDGPQDDRVAILFNDVSERKRHEERTRQLTAELNHRLKNMLSLVQAIARQTAASGADDFVDRFAERVQALSEAQDLLVRNAGRTVPVADLVRSQLAHFADLVGTRIEIAGPPLPVAADAMQAIGMALHELATNAAKYGALSNDSGRIAICWSVDRDGGSGPRFALSWRERGGPRVTRPDRRGFGSRVTGDLVQLATRGEVSVDYDPEGLAWRLSCPAADVIEG
jgi:PAS domain S-box-containing protein